MAIDPRRRQKKLERRRAKQKAERRELARREAGGLPARLARAAAAPILHCSASSTLWEEGIGEVLISRQLTNGQVAAVVFLVDMYCLGVKDVIMEILPRARYEEKVYRKLADRFRLISLEPAGARKLVEGAVQYALDLGLPPYADYRTAKLIFGDIDAGACTEQYAYGKGGKPFFVAGPYDGPAKCEYILRTLKDRCGPEGYHYLMPLGEPSLAEWLIEDEEEEEEQEQEEEA